MYCVPKNSKKMFKLAILLAVAICSAQAFLCDDPKVNEASEKCAKEHDVDLTKLNKEKPEENLELFKQEKFQCFMQCVGLSVEAMNDKNEFQPANIAKFAKMDESKIKEYSDKCTKEVTEGSSCAIASNRAFCLMAKMHEDKKE